MDNAFAAYESGRTKYDAENYNGAIREFDKAVEYGLATDGLLHIRGLAKKAGNDFEGAYQDFNKAIVANPNYAKAFYDALLRSHKMDDKEGALLDYDKAIELNPAYVDAYYSRAMLKDNAGAYDDLSAAISIDSSDAKLYFARYLKRNAMKDHGVGTQDLDKFIELAPTDTVVSVADAYSLRALMRVVSNDFQGAIHDYSKVIEFDPTNANAFHGRGLAHLELGSESEGRKDLIHAISLGYQDED